MNPRTLNFFPPSFIVIEHLYIFSAVGAEDLSARPLAAILGETPDDSKTNEAPVFEITRAPDAAGIRIIRIGVVRVSELCGCHLDRAPGRRPQRGFLW